MAAKRIQKPAKPSKPAAPARPAAVQAATPAPVRRGPGRPPKPATAVNAAVAAPARPNGVARPAAPPSPAGPSYDELTRLVAEQSRQIQTLTSRIEKLQTRRGGPRTIEQITDGGADLLPADDWRVPYQGHVLDVHVFDQGRGGEIELMTDRPLLRDCLLAIPKDDDPKGLGTGARQLGQIALYWERTADGQYTGLPVYLREDQLAAIWPEWQDRSP